MNFTDLNGLQDKTEANGKDSSEKKDSAIESQLQRGLSSNDAEAHGKLLQEEGQSSDTRINFETKNSSPVLLTPPHRQEENEEEKPPDFQQTYKMIDYPELTKEDATEAIYAHVQKHCCWRLKTIRHIRNINIQSSIAYHYILESCMESRSTQWVHEPYKGQELDGPNNGESPDPWTIKMPYDNEFKIESRDINVPHTEIKRDCHSCNGKGKHACTKCQGFAVAKCAFCFGHGYRRRGSVTRSGAFKCFICQGKGYSVCLACIGKGTNQCETCEGKQLLKWLVRLAISRTTVKSEFITKPEGLPEDAIKYAPGTRVYQEISNKVLPLTNSPEEQINQASANFLKTHASKYPNDMIIHQRHVLRTIPVTECSCDFNDKSFTFFLYGLEGDIHAPEYPGQFFCACSII